MVHQTCCDYGINGCSDQQHAPDEVGLFPFRLAVWRALRRSCLSFIKLTSTGQLRCCWFDHKVGQTICLAARIFLQTRSVLGRANGSKITSRTCGYSPNMHECALK
eukprot:6136591-Amphidinium_carterae.1